MLKRDARPDGLGQSDATQTREASRGLARLLASGSLPCRAGGTAGPRRAEERRATDRD